VVRGTPTRQASGCSTGAGVLFGILWLGALVAVGIGSAVSLWAAVAFVLILAVFVLYAWATK
jgi:hypothetical protein